VFEKLLTHILPQYESVYADQFWQMT